MKYIIFFLISIIFSHAVTFPVFADFHMSPKFSLREEYNDNIYLDRSDKESDFITLIKPSFDVNFNTKLFELNLNLGIEYEKYINHSEEDDLRPNQDAHLDSTWNMYRDVFFLRVADIYKRVPIDDADKVGVDNNLVNLTDSNRFIINPYLSFMPNETLNVRLDYKYENIWYQDKDGNDADRHLYSMAITKKITPRIDADIFTSLNQYRPKNYNKSNLDKAEDEKYDLLDFRLGLLYNVSDKLSLYGTMGRSSINYVYQDDYDSNLMSAQIDYDLTDSLKIGGNYLESIADSVDNGAYKEKKYLTYIHYKSKYQIALSIFKSRSDYMSTSQRRNTWGANLSGDLPISEREGFSYLLNYTDYKEGFTGATSLSEVNSFDELLEYFWYRDNPLEDHKRYSTRIELYHQLRLGRASIGYTINHNNSDIDQNDYINNIIFVQLALTW